MSPRTAAALAALLPPVVCHAAPTGQYIVMSDTTISDQSHYNDQVTLIFPPKPSTLTLAPGGVTASLAGVGANATVTIAPNTANGNGGVTGSVFATSGAHYVQQGGAVTGDIQLSASPYPGAATASILGGAALGLVADDGSYASITGGTIANDGVTAAENSSVVISSGTVGGPLTANLGGSIELDGVGPVFGTPGVYTGRLSTGPAGYDENFQAFGPGKILVYGSNLRFTGTTLTGNLTDGGTIDATVAPGTNLYLNGDPAVPEPAALAAFGVGLLACGRRRR